MLRKFVTQRQFSGSELGFGTGKAWLHQSVASSVAVMTPDLIELSGCGTYEVDRYVIWLIGVLGLS